MAEPTLTQLDALRLAELYGLVRVRILATNGRVRKTDAWWTDNWSVASTALGITVGDPDRAMARHAVVEKLVEKGLLRITSSTVIAATPAGGWRKAVLTKLGRKELAAHRMRAARRQLRGQEASNG